MYDSYYLTILSKAFWGLKDYVRAVTYIKLIIVWNSVWCSRTLNLSVNKKHNGDYTDYSNIISSNGSDLLGLFRLLIYQHQLLSVVLQRGAPVRTIIVISPPFQRFFHSSLWRLWKCLSGCKYWYLLTEKSNLLFLIMNFE